MTLTLLSDVANHLWQSTLVLGVACGLAWLLRRNSARARFGIWTGASLKFLVPFAPLIAVGRAIGWPSTTTDRGHRSQPFELRPQPPGG
jgi:hypothetical protein